MSSGASKIILDPCCGGRMCWINKSHPNVIYGDIRTAPPGHISLRPNHTVEPDEILDFRNLPYSDESFVLVLFDPPHILRRNGKEGIMVKRYGDLDRETWPDDIRRGFKECFRVLKTYGSLIFKWSSSEIPLKDVLALSPTEPLFGHRTGKTGTTHWLTFLKGA